MKTLIVFAMLCGVAVADDQSEWGKRKELERKARDAGLNDHGEIPVKYHEMFGPYKIFGFQQNGRAVTFEARFIKIEKAMVFVGIDSEAMTESKQPQTGVWSIPLKVFDFQGQKALRDEHQKRLKAERDKKVLYPQPPPKKEEPKKAIAKDDKPKERATYGHSYRRINGKLIPIEIPMNKAAEEEVRKKLDKQAADEKSKAAPKVKP